MPEIHVTDEQGVTHIFPDGSTPEMIAQALKVKAPDTSAPDSRNSVQKFLDSSVTPPPGEKMDNSAQGIFNQAYYGVPQGLEHVVAHPLDTLAGIGHTIAHPIDSAVQMGKAFASKPVLAVGQALGATAAMQPVADLAAAGVQAVPGVAGRAVLLGKTPAAAYESALKPSTTLSQADRASIVKTGLDNAVPVSKAGVEKIGDLIDSLNDKIKGTIASDPTRPIDPNAVATRTAQTSARFANQVNARPDLNAIEASRRQFLTEQGQRPAVAPQPTGVLDAQGRPIMTAGRPAQPAPPMNAADAQSMKQGTYSVLRGKFGEQGSAAVEAQKALARGLKEEIAAQFPEISKLNSAESKLLDLQPVLERAVNRISNHQGIGIGTPIAGTAIKATTGSTSAGAVAMVLKSVLDNPTVKSRLAIAVSKAQKIPFSRASAKVQAYSTALGSTAGATQVNSSGDTPNQ